jgi:hypothetical protein
VLEKSQKSTKALKKNITSIFFEKHKCEPRLSSKTNQVTVIFFLFLSKEQDYLEHICTVNEHIEKKY